LVAVLKLLLIMEDIHTIYYNNFGIAFQWKRNSGKDIHRIQLIFRETGLFLTVKELTTFKKQIQNSLSNTKTCNSCTSKNTCRSGLLETPIAQISFAVSLNDLNALQNLIEGTLFQLGMDNLLKTYDIN